MRLRSLLAALIIGLSTLGLVGCGSDNEDNGFVAATQPAVNTTTGAVSMNFVQAQFAVGATAANLKFEFFANTTQAGTASLTTTVPFAATVTIQNVPVTTQSVRVTSFAANGVPLVSFTQNITVTAGVTNAIPTVATPTAVVLNQLVLTSSNVFPPNIANPITSLVVDVGALSQVYLVAVYSDGTQLIAGNLANYQPDPNNANAGNIFSVNNVGTVTGRAAGTANLVITFGTQTVQVPVTVQPAGSVNFTSISANAITVAAGMTGQLVATGTANNAVFSLDAARTTYAIAGGAGITISNTGLVTVAGGTAAGTTATVTVTYTNPNASVLTTTAVVTSS